MGLGITEPKFAFLDNDIQAVVKVYNGVEGNLVLFNEYLCYRLAILIGLEMPNSGICLLDKETKIMNRATNESNEGYGFYSTYLNKATKIVSPIISLIKNKDDFYKIILFDHIIYNTDRNEGNLLVQYYKNNILLKVIDHTHVFKNGAIWDKYCLHDGIKEKDYFSTDIMDRNSVLYGMFFEHISYNKDVCKSLIPSFRQHIRNDKISEIIHEMPNKWLPEQNDQEALKLYLLYRIEHLEDIIETIDRYLKR